MGPVPFAFHGPLVSARLPAWRRVWANLARSRTAALWAGAARAVETAPAPQEPWLPLVEAGRDFATDMYRGRVRFADHAADLHGTSPFDHAGPPAWSAVLHGFGWLRPLGQAAHGGGTPLARANARALVSDWIAAFGLRLDHPAWDPALAATRLDSWLTHGAWLMDGADDDLVSRFRRSLAVHVRALRTMRAGATDPVRAEVTASLALAQALVDGRAPAPPARRDVAQLSRAGLKAALLLWSRHARAHAAAGGEGVAAPELAGWLAAFQHAEGTFARFVQNDEPFEPVPETLADALEAATPSSRNALVRHREVDGTVLLVASGVTANVGAFELSDAAGRIVCSCGRGPAAPALAAALASPRAHSTLTLEAFSQPEEEPSVPTRADIETGEGGKLEVAHDRFRDLGATHARMLELTASGLNGMETLAAETASDREVVVRFHLHPDITPTPRGDNAVRLTRGAGSPGGARRDGPRRDASPANGGWTFFCLDATLTVEETALFAEGGPPVPSRQIVLRRPLENGCEIRWVFARDRADKGRATRSAPVENARTENAQTENAGAEDARAE